ncbi:MAG TPA: hypothetical protein VD978_22590 [Azospirillum sp.]|nr:hypothetical protein [Azospirillum sp.]
MAQDFRSLRTTAQSIGFHELRQALEISCLKQDLERIARESDGLRAQVEDAVEQVRARFAALTPEELADASRMAPLLQMAVKSLLDIRDAVRRIEVPAAGPVADADRADPPPFSLLHTAPPKPPRAPEPPPPAISAPVPSPPPSAAPHTPPASAADPASPPWLTPSGGASPRSNFSANRSAANSRPAQTVDWLGPPRR